MLSSRKVYVACGLGAAALSYAFIRLYLDSEQPLYLYDYGDYFRMSVDFSRKLGTGFAYWFNSLEWCIAHQDYNPSSIALLGPVHRLFGESRFVYIYALACLYLIPTGLICVEMAAAAVAPSRAPSPGERLGLFVCATLFWPLWTPLMRGYSDIVGLIPLGLAYLVVVRTTFLTKASLRHAVLLGALLWLGFMLRRWYALIVVAFEAATFFFMVLTLWQDAAGRTAARSRTALLVFAANGVALCVCLLLFQRPLVESVLTHSYAQEYAMYKSSLADTLWSFYDLLGLAIVGLAGLGTAFAIRDKANAVTFAVAISLMSFVVFFRIQTPDIHHTMGIVFWLIPALLTALLRLARAAKRGAAPAWIAFAAFFAASFSGVFVPAIGNDLPTFAHVFPSARFYPLRNDNYPQYERLIATIKTLAAPDRRAVVFAEAGDLNASLLLSIDPSITPLLTDPDASLVDLRDGFDFATLDARYAIVTAPAMVDHPDFQRVVTVPDDMIVSGTCIGAAYARVGAAFEVSGRAVFVYDRTKPVSDADRDCLVARLRAFYPDWVRTPSGFGPRRGAK